MKLTTQSASAYSPAELADLFNRSFEGYFMPVNFTEETFIAFSQRDEVDLETSRVLLDDHQTAGLALITRRGPVSRLAAMGMVTGLRGQGAGSWLLPRLLDEARQRGETRMLLEVIAQNEAGIHLYEKFGFTKMRRLLGFIAENPTGEFAESLQSCDLAEMIEAFEGYGLPNLPWQMDAGTLKNMPSPTFAFCLGKACIAITDPQGEHVGIRSLVTDRQSDATHLLKALFATYPGKTWHIPAIFPEELGNIFKDAGMKQEEISQWQMRADL